MTEDEQKTIGRKVLGLRRDHGWTQKVAAARSDVSIGTIQKIEAGRYVSPHVFTKYVEIFGTSLHELLQAERRPDDLDDESRSVGVRYRLASTAVRQAVRGLLFPKEKKP